MKMELSKIKLPVLVTLLAILCWSCKSDDSGNSSAADAAEDDNWPGNAVRVQETDLDTQYSDGWVHANKAHDWSGGTAASSVGPASMSFSFTGTRIRWIGWRESGAGIARVLLDGEPVGRVDLYSNTIKLRAPVFTSKELKQGPHILTIEATGTADNRSTGTAVIVDAFEIVSLDTTARPHIDRIEETDTTVSFTGTWNVDQGCIACSGGKDNYAQGPDALASFSFTGTRVRWLGWRKQAGGIAYVYLDGAFAAEVDLHSHTTSAQAPIFTSDVLAQGPHTLLIEASGGNNPAALGSVVSVDAFLVAR
jgi:hypothetical protein